MPVSGRPSEEVQKLRVMVREVVNASDPMGLIREGTPEDEYDAEVDDILAEYVRIGPDLHALTWVVQNAFDRWFTPGSVPLARSRFIAARLCELWPEHGSENMKGHG